MWKNVRVDVLEKDKTDVLYTERYLFIKLVKISVSLSLLSLAFALLRQANIQLKVI